MSILRLEKRNKKITQVFGTEEDIVATTILIDSLIMVDELRCDQIQVGEMAIGVGDMIGQSEFRCDYFAPTVANESERFNYNDDQSIMHACNAYPVR